MSQRSARAIKASERIPDKLHQSMKHDGWKEFDDILRFESAQKLAQNAKHAMKNEID